MLKRASGRYLPLLTLVLCTLLVGPGCNSGTGSSSGLPGALGFNGEVLILEGSLVGPSFAGGPGLIVAFTQFPNTPRVPGTTVGTPSNVLVYNLENFIGAQVSNATLPPLIAESFPGLDRSRQRPPGFARRIVRGTDTQSIGSRALRIEHIGAAEREQLATGPDRRIAPESLVRKQGLGEARVESFPAVAVDIVDGHVGPVTVRNRKSAHDIDSPFDHCCGKPG